MFLTQKANFITYHPKNPNFPIPLSNLTINIYRTDAQYNVPIATIAAKSSILPYFSIKNHHSIIINIIPNIPTTTPPMSLISIDSLTTTATTTTTTIYNTIYNNHNKDNNSDNPHLQSPNARSAVAYRALRRDFNFRI